MTNQEQYELICEKSKKYDKIRAEIDRQEKWLMKAGARASEITFG